MRATIAVALACLAAAGCSRSTTAPSRDAAATAPAARAAPPAPDAFLDYHAALAPLAFETTGGAVDALAGCAQDEEHSPASAPEVVSCLRRAAERNASLRQRLAAVSPLPDVAVQHARLLEVAAAAGDALSRSAALIEERSEHIERARRRRAFATFYLNDEGRPTRALREQVSALADPVTRAWGDWLEAADGQCNARLRCFERSARASGPTPELQVNCPCSRAWGALRGSSSEVVIGGAASGLPPFSGGT